MHPLDPISLSHHLTTFLLLQWLFEYLTVRPVSNSGSKTTVTLLSTRFEKTTMESTSQILIIYIWLQTLDELFLSTVTKYYWVVEWCLWPGGTWALSSWDVTCWEPMSTKVLMFDCKSTNAQEDGNLQTTKCKCLAFGSLSSLRLLHWFLTWAANLYKEPQYCCLYYSCVS